MLHPETERKLFGARLAKVRKDAGFTLDTAAAALTERGFQIGRGTIGAWETGRNVPDALALRWLARLYQVPVDVLFSDAPVELETIQLAAKLKAVVLNDSASIERGKRHIGQQTRAPAADKTVLPDELFNLTSREEDARNRPGQGKGQRSSAGASGSGRHRRKG